MSTTAEIAGIGGICLLGMIAPSETYQACFAAGFGAFLGGLTISLIVYLLPGAKKPSRQATIARWLLNFCCGVGLGPLAGALLTDVLPNIAVPIVMIASGFLFGAAGVAFGMLAWSALKQIIPTFIKSFFTSALTNLLNALNSSKPNAAPENRSDGN